MTDRALRVYDKPLAYDIAFGYRDFARETDLLLAWSERASGGRRPRSALEMAAGPARHAIEMASRGIAAAAIDLSPLMCEYAIQLAAERGVSLEVHCADMIAYDLRRRFDLAFTMLSSLGHVYTVEAMVRHLRTVAAHLTSRGTYVVELPHPRDLCDPEARKPRSWTERRGDIEVEVRWGSEDDRYDPIAEVLEVRVEWHVRSGGREQTRVDRCKLKQWGACAFEAAVKLSGAFEIAERHGDFELDSPLDSAPGAWRMIAVLSKTRATRSRGAPRRTRG